MPVPCLEHRRIDNDSEGTIENEWRIHLHHGTLGLLPAVLPCPGILPELLLGLVAAYASKHVNLHTDSQKTIHTRPRPKQAGTQPSPPLQTSPLQRPSRWLCGSRVWSETKETDRVRDIVHPVSPSSPLLRLCAACVCKRQGGRLPLLSPLSPLFLRGEPVSQTHRKQQKGRDRNRQMTEAMATTTASSSRQSTTTVAAPSKPLTRSAAAMAATRTSGAAAAVGVGVPRQHGVGGESAAAAGGGGERGPSFSSAGAAPSSSNNPHDKTTSTSSSSSSSSTALRHQYPPPPPSSSLPSPHPQSYSSSAQPQPPSPPPARGPMTRKRAASSITVDLEHHQQQQQQQYYQHHQNSPYHHQQQHPQQQQQQQQQYHQHRLSPSDPRIEDLTLNTPTTATSSSAAGGPGGGGPHRPRPIDTTTTQDLICLCTPEPKIPRPRNGKLFLSFLSELLFAPVPLLLRSAIFFLPARFFSGSRRDI